MTEPIAWRAKNIDDDEYIIYDYEPLYFDTVEPLYTVGQLQLHAKMTMNQSEFNEWKELYGNNEDGSGNVYFGLQQVIEKPQQYPNLHRMVVTPTKYQDNLSQSLFADLWVAYNPASPDETINIVPDKKWFVRSKRYKDYFLRVTEDFVIDPYTNKKQGKKFNTKEEAEEWVTPVTEAVLLPVGD